MAGPRLPPNPALPSIFTARPRPAPAARWVMSPVSTPLAPAPRIRLVNQPRLIITCYRFHPSTDGKRNGGGTMGFVAGNPPKQAPNGLAAMHKGGKALFDYWSSLRKGAALPAAEEFDLLALTPWLSDIMIMDVRS